MADNKVANSGSGGATFATDEIAGVDFPRAKLIHGADGVNDGDVSTANPLPVDARELGGVAVDLNAGNAGGGTQRVVVATDQAVISVNDNGGSLTVDGTVTADAGTNLNTSALALESGGNLATVAAGIAAEGAALASGVLLQGDDGTDRKNVNVDATTGDVQVDVTNTVTVSGTVTADAGTNLNTSALALETGGNLATVAGAVSGTEMQVDVVAALPAGTNNIGDVDIASAIPAGTNNIGDVDIASLPDEGQQAMAASISVAIASDQSVLSVDDNSGSLTVDNAGTFAVQNDPQTTGGLSIFRSLDLDETEEEVKATAGQVYGWYFANLSTSPRYLKFYNATAATVVVGTTTPVLTFPLPANSTDFVAGNALGAHGIAFATAITVAVTTALADADTGAPSANDVVLNLFYK